MVRLRGMFLVAIKFIELYYRNSPSRQPILFNSTEKIILKILLALYETLTAISTLTGPRRRVLT